MTDKELVKKALEAREKAYAPYSKFRVGAALVTDDGKIFTGCNVENASYGLTMCAERTAIFKAVSEGYKKFKAMAVAGDTADLCSPCGACRQIMAEFGDEWDVLMADDKGNFDRKKVRELLPYRFNADTMYRRNLDE